MVQLNRRLESDAEDFLDADKPAMSGPIDAAKAELADQHYQEPEVNRLKEWAQTANFELTEEAILDSSIQIMPLHKAIPLMVISSLALWGLGAIAVMQLF